MTSALDRALGAWQQCTRIVARVGRVLARWAATQSWGRLGALSLLALVAQSILTDTVLHWRDDREIIHGTTHREVTEGARGSGSGHADDEDGRAGDSDADVQIGWDGIKVTRHPKAGAATAGSTTGATEPDERRVIQRPTLGGWLRDVMKGALLLLIVYLIAAKIVMREAAKSDARAAEAEASAAIAAALAERETLQRQVAQAQLQALQAQVEPHFLFNTLASVDYLIETDPVRASAMQKNLIQYLRAALPQMRGPSSRLGREVDLIRAYLDILRVRMEERLSVVIEIPEGLRSAEFPPMMLQSLVENAIQHGVEPKPEGGEIRVSAAVVDGHLEVSVADSGIGLQAGAAAPTAGSGLGLANIRERLARLYPQGAALTLEPRQPSGALARIALPYRVCPGDAGTALASAHTAAQARRTESTAP
jgi:hypothetical protein